MQDFLTTEIARAGLAVIQALKARGHEAFFVGGCVRDYLLDIPVNDLDIATSALPEEVLAIFPHSHHVGIAFGVVLVTHGQYCFDVATFREEGEYDDCRHPQWVKFTSARQDVLRRDFTVNGLLLDPTAQIGNQLIDYVQGRLDLDNRVIRTIGDPDRRFNEDALRLLRGIRFAVTKDFQLDQQTYDSICKNAHLIAKISVERIASELNKILLSPRRRYGIELLMQTGLMDYIMPEVTALCGCEQSPEHHPEGDVYIHTCIMLDLLNERSDVPSLSLIWATLLHDIAKPLCKSVEESGRIRFFGHEALGAEVAETILKRLKYPNSLIDDVVYLVKNHMRLMNIQNVRDSKFLKWIAHPLWKEELELTRVDCASSNGNLENYHFACEREKSSPVIKQLPTPILNGRDLIHLGLQPGPEFKTILEKAYDAQLDGLVETKDEAIDFLQLRH